ncbi:MAG: flippase-like domain-containing protein [Candidatus Rokubacteria bacterium]|nr:flippase-like domain-containing protein [Candidatus Rokubacteria bacterium]
MSLPRHWAKVLLGVAVSAGLLAYLLASVDLRQVGHHLARTQWSYLALSVALGLLAAWARARRWRYLFPPDAAPSRLFSAVMIGYLGNNVLPLRAGELVRGYLAARHSGQGFWTAIATLVVERVLDALAVVLILAWLVLMIPVPDELKWGALVFLSLDLAAMAALTALVVVPEGFRALVSVLIGRWPRLLAKALAILETFTLGLRGIRTPSHLLPILLWSVGLWVLYALATWSALAAAQLLLSLTAAWAVVAFVGLGMSLPSAPGFVGVIQAAVVLALTLFDVPRAEALSFSFLYHASQLIPVTLVGWLLLMLEHASLLQLTRQAIPETDARGT